MPSQWFAPERLLGLGTNALALRDRREMPGRIAFVVFLVWTAVNQYTETTEGGMKGTVFVNQLLFPTGDLETVSGSQNEKGAIIESRIPHCLWICPVL
jgi:hypothetical protein